jgi:hypothetical protein
LRGAAILKSPIFWSRMVRVGLLLLAAVVFFAVGKTTAKHF